MTTNITQLQNYIDKKNTLRNGLTEAKLRAHIKAAVGSRLLTFSGLHEALEYMVCQKVDVTYYHDLLCEMMDAGEVTQVKWSDGTLIWRTA